MFLVVNVIRVIRSFPAQYQINNDVSGAASIKHVRENGRKDFQVRFIKRSYRIRGKEARVQINIKATKIVFIVNERLLMIIFGWAPEKNTTVKSLMIRIFMYSAIKIRAKGPALYSVLNPDTSSDSPSAKSKGVRFVSAKEEANQHKKSGGNIKITQDIWVVFIIERLKVSKIVRAPSRIRDILTS